METYGSGRQPRPISLHDAIGKYYTWVNKHFANETGCVHCNTRDHRMQFRRGRMENGDRHLLAKCPNIKLDINMGRSVPISTYVRNRQTSIHNAKYTAVIRQLNSLFEYSKSAHKDLPAVPAVPESGSALLSDMYIYENTDIQLSEDVQSIRRKMQDLHKNSENIPDYENQLKTTVQRWMQANAERQKNLYLPGHVRSTVSLPLTKDSNQKIKFPKEPAVYMLHYTSDPKNMSIPIGNPPIVAEYKTK
jgi:hypothetical protein